MALALKGPTHFGKKGPTGSGPDLRTGIDPVHITPTSNMVREYTGMAVQPHKAIVGANAFQHESGIHQDGMIKNKQTYEIMTPGAIGLMRGDQQSGAGIVLGKHSGRNAVSTRLNELGYDLDDDKLQAIFVRFKEVAERKKGGLDDDDLEAFVADEVYSAGHVAVGASAGDHWFRSRAHRDRSLTGPDGVERQGVAMGTGPVDAAYKAIDALTSVKVHLETYSMESVNAGIEAMATTKVVVNPVDSATSLHSSGYTTSRKFSGSGSDTDVVVSSPASAFCRAVNADPLEHAAGGGGAGRGAGAREARKRWGSTSSDGVPLWGETPRVVELVGGGGVRRAFLIIAYPALRTASCCYGVLLLADT